MSEFKLRLREDRPATIQEHAKLRNLLRDALSWFDSHEVERRLDHTPEWVVTARQELKS